MRAALVLGLCGVLGIVPSAQRTAPAPVLDQFNILMIVLDDVGVDKIELFDELSAPPYPRTPRLNELSMRGMRFTRYYTAPICSPARAALLTGRYPFRTGMGSNSEVYRLPDEELLLPELLRLGLPPERAYATGAFGKWHLGQLDPSHPVSNGFQRFRGTVLNEEDHFQWDKIEHDEGQPPSAPIPMSTWSASDVRADALGWINAQTRPFFAYVAFSPPHGHWQVPPLALVSGPMRQELAGYAEGQEAVGLAERRLFYRAMLEAVDTDIGTLLDGIEPTKRARTMVFVVADNGTEGDVVQLPHDPSHGKPSGYEIAIRAPLIVAGPLNPSGAECTRLVEAVDLFQTIADVTGASPELAFQRAGLVAPYPTLDSQSLLPLLHDPNAPGPNPWAFTELFAPCGPYESSMCLRVHLRTLTDGEYKYMRWVQKHTGAPLCSLPQYSHELYRISTDPEETQNLLLAPLSAHDQAVYDYLRNEMDVLSSNPGHYSRR